jgi:hypothetical protein
VVVELNPVADHTHGVLSCFKAMPVDALFFERADEPLDHSVLLRAMRCEALLFESAAAHQPSVRAARADQTVVRRTKIPFESRQLGS